MSDVAAQIARRALIASLCALPRNAMSRLAGRAAGLTLPTRLREPLLGRFARSVGADLSETRDPLASFPSLQAFFTRELRPGARPIGARPDALVSPCDGAWGVCGRIASATALQLKGIPYSIGALLGAADAAREFEGGEYATLYLSPRDYHRFHAPCRARVERASYLPGSLWPVNRAGLEGVPGLFTRNERIAVWLRPDEPASAGSAGRLCVVAVGATMVGKVRLSFDDLETNRPGRGGRSVDYPEPPPHLERGEEFGRFEFGSTLVLLAAPGLLRFDPGEAGRAVCLGRPIGSWTVRGA